jgi:hypothetical protein
MPETYTEYVQDQERNRQATRARDELLDALERNDDSLPSWARDSLHTDMSAQDRQDASDRAEKRLRHSAQLLA